MPTKTHNARAGVIAKCQEKVLGSVGGSCANGVCKCGEADKTIQSTTKFFSKPIAEGMVEAGKVIQKVAGGVTFAIKRAIKIGSWAIPGVGKPVAKPLNLAAQLVETGNQDADKVLSQLEKWLP
ncbi:hypothetical protein MMC30_009108 [Trapelia coarctata]|nr:hypothetical protein [Trapelia coarctata]